MTRCMYRRSPFRKPSSIKLNPQNPPCSVPYGGFFLRVVLFIHLISLISCAELHGLQINVILDRFDSNLKYTFKIIADDYEETQSDLYLEGSTYVLSLPLGMWKNISVESIAKSAQGECSVQAGMWKVTGEFYDGQALDAPIRMIDSQQCPLTIKAIGAGGALVECKPAGKTCHINAGEACTLFVPTGMTYELVPQPDGTSFVSGWKNMCSSATLHRCSLNLNQSQSLTLELGAKKCNEQGWCVEKLPAEAAGTRLRAMAGSSENDIWVVGLSGTILHWDGTTWSTTKLMDYNLVSVAVPNSTTAWIASPIGGLFRRKNTTWEKVSTLDPSGMEGVSSVAAGGSPSNVWIAADSGLQELRGEKFQLDITSGRKDFISLGFAGDSLVGILSDGTIQSKTDDKWKSISNNITGLTAVQGANPDDFWVAGRVTMHYQMGQLRLIDNLSLSNALWVVNADQTWLVKNAGIVHKYNAQNSPNETNLSALFESPRNLSAIWADGDGAPWIAADPGQIVRLILPRSSPK